MITCRLKGGICNLMFQIAGIEYLGKTYKLKVVYPNAMENINYLNSEQKHNPKLSHALEYLKIFKKYGFKFLDLTFIENSNDDEFYDGFHGSTELYRNIALTLYPKQN